MKNGIFTLVLALTVSVASAQALFTLDHDVLVMSQPDPSVPELILDNHITNNTPNDLNLVWTRTINNLATNLTSSICIRDLCYASNVSTKTFKLNPNENAIVSAHLWNLVNHPSPNGVVEVKIHLASDSTAFQKATFIYDQSLHAGDGPTVGSVKAYPNPATDRVTLDGAEDVAAFRVVDRSGRTLLTATNDGNNTLSVSELSAGMYYILLYDATGTARHAVKFSKN